MAGSYRHQLPVKQRHNPQCSAAYNQKFSLPRAWADLRPKGNQQGANSNVQRQREKWADLKQDVWLVRMPESEFGILPGKDRSQHPDSNKRNCIYCRQKACLEGRFKRSVERQRHDYSAQLFLRIRMGQRVLVCTDRYKITKCRVGGGQLDHYQSSTKSCSKNPGRKYTEDGCCSVEQGNGWKTPDLDQMDTFANQRAWEKMNCTNTILIKLFYFHRKGLQCSL